MSIQMSELLTQSEWDLAGEDIRSNLYRLHYSMNVVRVHYDSPMIVTSGFRSMERHVNIYASINENRKIKGLPVISIPMGSMHLRGAACDISDPDSVLKTFVVKNLRLVEDLGLYMEAFDATPSWVHFQIYPPKSLTRFFRPF